VADSVADRRFQMNAVLLFAAAALVLAMLGVYGVISQTVAQRTSEIGIRLALGATGRTVVLMVLRDALRLVAAGLLVGVPLALGVGSMLRSFLFGVSVLDGPTLAGACAVLTLSAALAAYIPASRAGSIDPMVALRHE
jgi:ABC-type antimicrobial peptide transport system permease subunit